jgi:hypothetical protein
MSPSTPKLSSRVRTGFPPVTGKMPQTRRPWA